MEHTDGFTGRLFPSDRQKQKRERRPPNKKTSVAPRCSRARRLRVIVYHKRPRLARLRKGFLMIKDRKTLLEQMYDGEFNPTETVVSGNPDYVAMSRQEGEEIEYIASRLNDEDKVRFDMLMDLLGDTEHMNGYANFAYGLRTGILLMFELFTSESKKKGGCHYGN